MRKFFALALAVAMVLSLASVAFAATADVAAVALEGPFRYDADKNLMKANDATDREVMRYGEGTYYLIKILDAVGTTVPDEDTVKANGKPIKAYKEVEKLKVKADFEMGEDLVESVSIVKKFVEVKADSTFKTKSGLAAGGTADDYYYFIEVKVAKKETIADADIVATLEFNRKADDEVHSTSLDADGIGKIKDNEVDISFNVFYKNTWLNGYARDGHGAELLIKNDIDNLEYDTDYALKFECDDEVELSFGHPTDGDNEGTFTVDVSGQGKLYLRYNTKADEAIAAANPGAKLYFLNFNNVKFNRVGEFVYEMDDIAAAYKVVDGQLVEIKGLELDADSATFNTRVLESYVFADTELVNPAPVAAVEAPAAEVTNPTTGAAA